MKNLLTQKYKLVLTTGFLAILSLPGILLAASGRDTALEGLDVSGSAAALDTSTSDLPSMIGNVINYLFGLVGVIFLIVIIIGGVTWMTAGGAEDKVGKAKKMITEGSIGVVVIFLAYAIVYFVLQALKFGVTGE